MSCPSPVWETRWLIMSFRIFMLVSVLVHTLYSKPYEVWWLLEYLTCSRAWLFVYTAPSSWNSVSPCENLCSCFKTWLCDHSCQAAFQSFPQSFQPVPSVSQFPTVSRCLEPYSTRLFRQFLTRFHMPITKEGVLCVHCPQEKPWVWREGKKGGGGG